jgi:hypothetical protein
MAVSFPLGTRTVSRPCQSEGDVGGDGAASAARSTSGAYCPIRSRGATPRSRSLPRQMKGDALADTVRAKRGTGAPETRALPAPIRVRSGIPTHAGLVGRSCGRCHPSLPYPDAASESRNGCACFLCNAWALTPAQPAISAQVWPAWRSRPMWANQCVQAGRRPSGWPSLVVSTFASAFCFGWAT